MAEPILLNNVHISRPLPLGSASATVVLMLNPEIVKLFERDVFPKIQDQINKGERRLLGDKRTLFKFELSADLADDFVKALTVACYELQRQLN